MREGFARRAHKVADAAAAVELLEGLLRPGDAVLVKGSRGVGLEHVGDALEGAAVADDGSGAEGVVARAGADRPGRR
jgi:hypothetical protein